ncbi:GTP-binding protein, partial [Campylobacter jejuni]
DKDGKVRFTEELTNNDLYKKHYPDHKEYIELILEEFQKFGGNSILNIFRGGGVYIMKFYAMLQKNLM